MASVRAARRSPLSALGPALALVLALLAGCGGPPEAAPTPEGQSEATIALESRLLDAGSGRPAEGEPAPDFSYTMPDGSEVRLSDLRGKRVLINFWATWCLPCIEEMPELQRAFEASGGDLVVLAVNRNETPEAIARFAPRVAVSFPLIPNLAGDIGDRYGVTSLPITYFINSDGTVAARQFGALSADLLAERLEATR